MPDTPNLRPADPDELQRSLAHALKFDGRRHHHRADGFMAEIAAVHLMACLEQSGFVIMKKPLKNTQASVPSPRTTHLTE
jgi:hypothetical protein